MRAIRDPEEDAPLIPIERWREQVLSGVSRLPAVALPLVDTWGCVLAADVHVPADLPGFTSSAMDGFAVRAADIAAATQQRPVELRVAGEVRMGRPPTVSVDSGEAVAVPTGGVVPSGADAVVPIELCTVDGERVLVLRSVPAGKHVRLAGEDARAGDLLAAAGRRLLGPDLGALASTGVGTVDVYPRARVGIISTGDELVAPGEQLGEAQIYDANAPILAGAVREADAVPVDGGVAGDSPEALVAALDGVVGEVDVLVCSGGVSAGERDPVKRAFVKGEVNFANVAMQPGRPQAFGAYRGTPFFGLPGNPVSVFVSFVVFVYPALMKMMGRDPSHPEVTAFLDSPIDAPRTRARYARVRLHRDGDRLIATPEGGHQSNLLATFARADGLAIIPPGETIGAGERCRVIPIRESPWI